MIIFSGSLIKNENFNLLRQLPISLNKIISSKLIFIVIIYFFLSILYFSFLNIPKEEFPLIVIFIIHIYCVFLLSFLNFSFCSIFKKEIAFFFTYIIFLLNLIVFYHIYKITSAYILIKFEVYIIYLFLFAFSLFLFFYLPKYLYFGKKFGFKNAIFIFFILIFPSIFLFLKKSIWMKEYTLIEAIADYYPISKDEMLIQDYKNWEIYSYNLKSKNLKPLNSLIGLRIHYYFEDNLIFRSRGIYIRKFCNKKIDCSMYYFYKVNEKKLKKVGFYPYGATFLNSIVFWYKWKKDESDNTFLINFKNLENDLCFSDYCQSRYILRNGIIYRKKEKGEEIIYYVDFENGKKIEILKGEYLIRLGYPYQKDLKNYAYLLKDGKCYKFYSEGLKIEYLGEIYPLAELEKRYLLAFSKKDKKLILLKDYNVIKELNFPYDIVWGRKDPFSGKQATIFAGKKGEEADEIIVYLENEEIKIYSLKKNQRFYSFLKKEGEIIILKEKKFPFLDNLKFNVPHIYNFKTGKERVL